MLDKQLFQKVTKDVNGRRIGLKHTEYPEFKEDMQKSVREFNNFVSEIIDEYNGGNEIYKLKTKGVNNNWQNSGYYKPYFWNKILLHNNDYDGVIFWLLFNIEGLRITIGTTNTLETVNSILSEQINDDMKKIFSFTIDGFDIVMDDKYVSYLYRKDEVNKNDFVKALNIIVPKYNDIFQKYLSEIFNNDNFLDLNPEGETQMINQKNIILYGAPGVGKTHNTNKLIRLIEDGKSDREIFETIKSNEKSDSVDISDIKDRVKFVTFHQSFGYEDFIEGFRPNEDGKIELVDGVFKAICKEAEEKEENYYLVIDEINRGNISKIFGELITLIEEDKRDNLEVTLPYSKQPFKIPSNLYIIGTMNSTDKSIALIDIALRRRFTFLKMKPKADLIDYVPAKMIFENLNERIIQGLGEDYQLGHSYFMTIQNDDDLNFVLEYKIKPLLEEYFYGDEQGLKEVLELL